MAEDKPELISVSEWEIVDGEPILVKSEVVTNEIIEESTRKVTTELDLFSKIRKSAREEAMLSASEDEKFTLCPTCRRETRIFLIQDDTCSTCRTEIARESVEMPTIGWGEVRHRRDLMITATDWTQLEDVDPKIRNDMKQWRQALRDITKEANPSAAWEKLKELLEIKPK